MFEIAQQVFLLGSVVTPANVDVLAPMMAAGQRDFLGHLADFDEGEIFASTGFPAWNVVPMGPADHTDVAWSAWSSAWVGAATALVTGMLNNQAKEKQLDVNLLGFRTPAAPVPVTFGEPVAVSTGSSGFFGLRLFPANL